MSSTMVDGVRLDYVRRCKCGRQPVILTTYEGLEPGWGPFIIKCYCDTPEDAVNEHGFRPHPRFCRSWSKTRAVRIWRDMNRLADANPAKAPPSV